MGQETQTTCSVDIAEAPDDTGLVTPRALRLEVLELRRQLKQRDEVAARQVVMLREGDHRIKNSLQIVASLMTLQERSETSPSARQALRSAGARVRSVAAIHDALQGAAGADSVDLGEVLRSMCGSLQTMAGARGHIAITVDAPALQTQVALAQPIVLAVNELVVNALRHAFPVIHQGEVWVTLTHDGAGIKIVVADNGIGLPNTYAAGQGYGMKLLTMITRQVGGALDVETRSGTHFTLRVPMPTAA